MCYHLGLSSMFHQKHPKKVWLTKTFTPLSAEWFLDLQSFILSIIYSINYFSSPKHNSGSSLLKPSLPILSNIYYLLTLPTITVPQPSCNFWKILGFLATIATAMVVYPNRGGLDLNVGSCWQLLNPGGGSWGHGRAEGTNRGAKGRTCKWMIGEKK